MDRDTIAIVIGAAFEAVALVFAVGLWRGPGRVLPKLAWTAVLAVPAFGLIAFVVGHAPPPPSDPIDRPGARDWDFPPPPGRSAIGRVDAW